MKRFAGLVVLTTLAIPANASNRVRVRMEKPRPAQSAEPPLALPIAPNPPASPTPVVNDRVLRVALYPGRVLANLVRRGYDSDLDYCRLVLSGTSPDLAEARIELHRFWMNNQPSVRTYLGPGR